MQELVNTLNSFIWSPALIYLCLGAGVFFTVLTKCVQVRQIKEMWRLLVAGKSSEKGISSFQALAVSLSGRVGTGNIAGVAAAIGFGGPGAVFWMWIVAFFGAATAYIESTNAQIYKEEVNGVYRGGPAYYIEKATGQTWYAWVFALSTILACGALLPTVQSNSLGEAAVIVFGTGEILSTFFGDIALTKLITASAIVLLLGFIIFGGIKRIANVTQVVVPFMAFAYIIIACVIIGLHIERLPDVFMLIINDAFSPMAGVGAAIGWGVKRGVYSNEAGQGTGPHAAAAAEVQHPAQQGLVQAFSVYIDTLFVCSATAFMILITQSYNVQLQGESSFIVKNIAGTIAANSPAYTQIAVESMFTGIGKPFIALALFFFSFTTLLAYYFIAENNVVYIKQKLKIPGLIFALKVLIMSATFYGTIKAADIAWGMGDVGVGIMAWTNIIGIIIIFFVVKPAIKALKDYEEQKKSGVENYSFDPKKLGINNAKFWEDKCKK